MSITITVECVDVGDETLDLAIEARIIPGCPQSWDDPGCPDELEITSVYTTDGTRTLPLAVGYGIDGIEARVYAALKAENDALDTYDRDETDFVPY